LWDKQDWQQEAQAEEEVQIDAKIEDKDKWRLWFGRGPFTINKLPQLLQSAHQISSFYNLATFEFYANVGFQHSYENLQLLDVRRPIFFSN